MNYLDELLALRRITVEGKKAQRPVATLREAARGRNDIRNFAAALRSGSPSIVAEFKRASPSAGAIELDADPARVARDYERGGASALSVLTEPDRFKGSFDDLRATRAAVGLPVLCKDFIVDEYQVWEAVAEGADAVLLIVAALEPTLSDVAVDLRSTGAASLETPLLRRLIDLATSVGVTPLVEVHDEREAAQALAAGARVIGINNRDLTTFRVDLSCAPRVRKSLPASITVVAESGYTNAEAIAECARQGIHAVLVGESLMRQQDRAAALARLREHPL